MTDTAAPPPGLDQDSFCPAGLVMERVTRSYGRLRVVDDLTLAVPPGELVCLLGPSGCGKTTTLRMAAGLETPDSGRILLNGQLVGGEGAHVPPEKRNVGFLFQDYALFPHLDALTNVEFGLLRMDAAARRARALEMLAQVGMEGYAQAWPHQLSGGQMQRVALARALAPRPRLMLLDEPFSGLDKRLRDQVRDETLHVLKSSGVCTLMVTHDPEEAMFMADRIAIMRQGRMVQTGEPENLYRHPADSFVASFFGEVNRLPVTVQDGWAATPLGLFEARNVRNGEQAELIIRPEALTLSPRMDGIALVMAINRLGRSTLVHLKVESAGGAPLHLHARTSGTLPHIEGMRVALSVDRAQAYVFPLTRLPELDSPESS
jgi:iron(III) transport system ATP-binding protein